MLGEGVEASAFSCHWERDGWRRPLARDSPNGQFGAIRGADFAENPIQIFLDRALSKVQLISDFLIELGFADEVYHLPLPKTQRWIERFLDIFGDGTALTNSLAAFAAKLLSASKTVS